MRTPIADQAAHVARCASARRQYSEIELEHALRATAAQHLRVAAASHAHAGDREPGLVALEQAIADRIDRVVRQRRAAVDRVATVPVRDELALRRVRRGPTAHVQG